ncbi:MAG: leucine-rich repeat domain-containing protein [Bacteroidaceae bacterium]|nr:leucine-rich repeat domain-containing protein [Bacteroidaceae bacterium]
MALLLYVCATATAENRIKDRDYYIAQNDNTNYASAPGTVIKAFANAVKGATYGSGVDAVVNLGNFFPNSTQGVYYTVLAILPSRDAEGYDGYVVAGAKSEETNDGYLSSTFATLGVFDRNSDGTYGDADDKYLCIPKELTITNSSHIYSGKKFKVVGIDYGAFSGMEVAQIILPSTVTYIGYRALYNAGAVSGKPCQLGFWNGEDYNSLYREAGTADWTAHNNIEYVADNACEYSNYPLLENLLVPAKLKQFGNQCFLYGGLTKIDLTSSYTNWDKIIPWQAFAYNKKLATADLTAAERVKNAAFYNCSVMTSLTLGSGLTALQDSAFAYCSVLNNPDFSSVASLPTIAYKAFYYCRKLATCKQPQCVTTIGDEAFAFTGFKDIFNIPKHVKSIGRQAYYRTYITYIPISADKNVNADGLFIGDGAFTTGGENLTVEFTDNVAPLITTDGKPFAVYYITTAQSRAADLKRLRLIVPIGCGEAYVHDQRINIFSSVYDHHDYRVKFDLRYSYNKPQWGEPGNMTESPWYIASSAWHNDIYNFRPDHGGSVDTYTVTTATDQNGDNGQLGTVVNDFYIKPGTATAYARDYETNTLSSGGVPHVMPRTAHKYHDNEDVDDIPRIATAEVSDGIAPYDQGILLSYTRAAYYLVPLFANYASVVNYTNVRPRQYSVSYLGVGDIHDSDASTPRISLKVQDTYSTVEALEGLKGQTWVDLRERRSKWRQLREYYYDESGNLLFNVVDKNLFIGEDERMADDIDLDETIAFTRTVTLTDEDGNVVEDENGQPVTYTEVVSTHKRYVYYTANSQDETSIATTANNRCGVYYMRYTIPSDINWTLVKEQGEDYLWEQLGEGTKVLVKPGFGDSSTNPSPADLGISGTGAGNRRWIDIFELTANETLSSIESSSSLRSNFHDNHIDQGNVLVPCYDRTMVYPYWKVITEEDYNDLLAKDPSRTDLDIAYYHHVYDDTGAFDYAEKEYVQGKSDIEMTTTGDYGEGFVSFGLNNGCFVQAKNPGQTQANRSYFRIHTARLHSSAHKLDNTSNVRAIIVDENDFEDDITGLGATVIKPSLSQGWYTLDGRRIATVPSRPGIYINGGKKVVIR